MATSTTNYSFTLPEVGGDTDQWGTQLNANWTLADTTLKTIADSVGDDVTLTGNDYLTISGQAITVGDVDLTTDVTGTLPVASGGTGLAALGTANQVLAVNSAADGLEFQTVSGSGTVTSVTVSGSDGIEVDSGSPITTSGTIALGINSTTLSTHLGLGDLATQSSVTESQISDLGSYITASSTDTLTNKSGNISQWTNDSGYLTAETNDLSSVSGTLAIANGGTGLSAIGTANQVLAVNSGATGLEFQTISITESQISDLQPYLTADVANTFTANQIISVTDNTNAALRVTQLGTGNALVVEDSTNPDSTPFVVSTNGNVGIGEVSTDSKLQVGTAQFDPSLARTTAAIIVRSDTGSTTGDGEYSGAITFGKIDSSRPFGSIAGVQIGSDIDGGGLAFFTKNGTSTNDIVTERMRIDSSGNVGIGTLTIDSLLHLEKTDATAYDATATDGQVGVGPTIYLQNPSNNNGTVGGQIVFGMRSTEEHARIGATGGTAPALTFGTADAERMRITSSGDVLLRTTSSTIDSTNFGTNLGVVLKHSRDSGSAVAIFYGSSGETRILGTGEIDSTTGVHGTISDIRLKENIVDATAKLQDLLRVRIVNYNLKEFPDKKLIGVVAQELEQIFPDLVSDIPDEDQEGNDLGTTTKSVKTSVFIPMLIKAIQEQQTIIESQQSQIDALTARIEALETT